MYIYIPLYYNQRPKRSNDADCPAIFNSQSLQHCQQHPPLRGVIMNYTVTLIILVNAFLCVPAYSVHALRAETEEGSWMWREFLKKFTASWLLM
jgi:hypothetical protein